MRILLLSCFVVQMLVFSGCSTPEYLFQPQQIPLYVKSYSVPSLSSLRKVEFSINVLNCVNEVTLTSLSFSGQRKPESLMSLREVVLSEFDSAIDANFKRLVGKSQPDVELKIETHRALLERDGDDMEFDIALSIHLLNPSHMDKPYFSKRYAIRTRCERLNKEYVPPCVYEAVQKIAAEFLSDLSQDQSLVSRLSKLGVQKGIMQ